MSNADLVSRKLTFSWSTDCDAMLHYNILASNYGSCPTTTNHTNVICTNVQTNGSVCTFAVQAVVCGSITGQVSNSIRVSIQNPTDNLLLDIHNSDTSRVYIISISVLAAALIASVVVSITVIVIVIARRKAAKTQAGLDLQLTNRTEKSRLRAQTQRIITYEDVTGPLPSASAINTQDNVAYGHTHTSSNTDSEVNLLLIVLVHALHNIQ